MGINANVSKRGIVTTLRILYPVWTLIALPSLMYVTAAVVVSGDPASTASNLTANPFLYNLSIIGSLVTQLIHIVMEIGRAHV